jgi:hypothetical protein
MSYYIVGSKYEYELNHYEDVFPQMEADNSLCVGFASDIDLTSFYCQPEKAIVNFLKSKKENRRSFNALKKYLNLCEGDLVAIKSYCAPLKNIPRLVVSAICIVTSRNGVIYKYEPDNYGHRINIEFLKKNMDKEYKLSYGQTVHKLSNVDHIKEIFQEQIGDIQNILLSNSYNGVTNKNLDKQLRKINAEYIANAYHNRIQTKLFNDLVSIYGESKVKMEVDFIDVLSNVNGETTLYEVKPYEKARSCIRESLGQLIEYSWYKKKHFHYDNIKLVMVGPTELNAEEQKYFEYVKKSLSFSLEYKIVR